MNLSRLLELIKRSPAFQRVVQGLRQRENGDLVVLDAAKPFTIAAIFQELGIPVLVVTAQPEAARKLHEQLLGWYPSGQLMLFPEPDVLPYERLASDITTEMDRIQVLNVLTGQSLHEEVCGPPLVVASTAAIMSRTTAYGDFVSTYHSLKLGMDREPLELLGE